MIKMITYHTYQCFTRRIPILCWTKPPLQPLLVMVSVWLAAAEGSSTPEAPLTVKHRFGLLKVNDFLPQIGGMTMESCHRFGLRPMQMHPNDTQRKTSQNKNYMFEQVLSQVL